MIRQRLAAEPLLKNAKLDVRVGARDITVSGTVDDQRQHDLALQVVQSDAGDRQIVDKIKLRS
jgi:osmotically-inducible protein OsmY